MKHFIHGCIQLCLFGKKMNKIEAYSIFIVFIII